MCTYRCRLKVCSYTREAAGRRVTSDGTPYRSRVLFCFVRRYFSSYMSQPKFQLETFRAWAGKSSDISYYLNSHHIDVHCWINEGKSPHTSTWFNGSWWLHCVRSVVHCSHTRHIAYFLACALPCVVGMARPVWVTAMGSTGVAESEAFKCPKGTEDTITVMCQVWLLPHAGGDKR